MKISSREEMNLFQLGIVPSLWLQEFADNIVYIHKMSE